MKFRLAITTALVLTTTSAEATLYAGNPHFELKIQHTIETLTGDDVVVDKLVLIRCDDTTVTDNTDITFDPETGASWSIPSGDWCGANVWWKQDVVLTGNNAYGDFELLYEEPYTHIDLDPSPSGMRDRLSP